MGKPLRVLMIEDSAGDAELLLHELRRGGYEPEARRVENEEQTSAALDESSWDVVFADRSLPTFSGFEALELITERGLDIPLILISGTMNEEDAVAALRAGAKDFVSKSRFARLVPAVEREMLEASNRAERRGELERTQRQLSHFQKMEALGQLSAEIAHDFNNLLLAVRGYADLALGQLSRVPDAAAGELRKSLDSICEAEEKGVALTRELLAFGRERVLKPRSVDLNEVVANAEGLLRRMLGGGIELEVRFSEDPCRAELDPVQLENSLVNLAVNARHAMEQGGRLTVQVGPADLTEPVGQAGAEIEPGRYGRITVEDTGAGMEEDVRSRVFEPFFSTKGELGTGLGLSTVYGFVRQSGGAIVVDSEIGTGTRFVLYLPLAESST